MKYVVTVRQVVEKDFRVDARSVDSAKKKALAKLSSGEVSFGADNICDVEAFAFPDDCVEDGGDLVVACSDIKSTVSLMDEFESRKKDQTKKYRRLILRYYKMLGFGHGRFVWMDLIVERIAYGKATVGDLTMSQMKSGHSWDLSEYLESYVRNKFGKKVPDRESEIKLDIPYCLRAQTSGDRIPGGWECGTKYGDTHQYGVVGIKISLESDVVLCRSFR